MAQIIRGQLKGALVAALVASCHAYAPIGGRAGRAVLGSRVANTRRTSTRAVIPPDGSWLLAAASAQSTSVLFAAEQTDVFRLALTGGVGIMVFSVLNAFLVGAVARGNWQVFEDEAASWIQDEPGMAEMRSNLLNNEDLLVSGDEADDALDEESES